MTTGIYIATGIIGAVLPYFLTRRRITDPVKASALPSLILGVFFYAFPSLCSEPFQTDIPVLFFGASFVGMVNTQVFPRYFQVVLSGVIFALLYEYASDFFNGFGGGLGTPACISVVCIYGLRKLKAFRHRRKNTKS